MIDRRHLSMLLMGSALGIAGCASGGGGEVPDAAPEMLFISPMGEPFRAKPPAPYPVDVWFKGADKNGDGKLDLDEFLADATRFFHVLDVNKDGVIDHREIYYYEHVTVPEVLNLAYGALTQRLAKPRLILAQFGGGGMGGGPGGGGGMGPSGPPPSAPPDTGKTLSDRPFVGAAAYGLLADPEPVQGSDLHLSGLISLADFRTRADQRFKLLDNHDRGYLTLDTLPETQAQSLLPHPRGRDRGRKA
jgi:hypothetical protein